MDRETVLGGSVGGVLLRLVVVSVIVGMVLSLFGITPDNLFQSINDLFERLYRLGFGWIKSAFGYFILGAMIVVPIWLVTRAVHVAGRRRPDDAAKR